MKVAITMLTAPRPTPTLAASLASLRAAGFSAPLVVEDLAGLGAIGNFQTALRGFLAGDGEWWLHVEDDTTWQPGARDALAQAIAPLDLRTFGALSLHCMRYVSQRLQRRHGGAPLAPGLYESPLGAATRGSQALLFTRASAEALAHSPHFAHCAYVGGWLDASIGGALRALGLPLLYLLPCLARHELGLRNSCWLHGAAARSPLLECDY